MTLIDTVPGFAATLRVLGAELGRRVPGRGDDRRTSGRRWSSCSRRTSRPTRSARRATGSARSTPTTPITSVPALPGAHEALAAVRRHRGRIVLVTGKFPANAQRHIDHLGLDVDLLEGWVWGVGKADALRREGVSIYVGDHVHDVEGARAAGALSVSRADRRLHARRARGRPAPTWCSRASRSSRPGSTSTCSTTRLEALERDLRGPRQRPGRLQRRRRQRLPARRRGPRARARSAWSPRPATPTRCPRSSATRPAPSPRASASRCSPRRPTRWSATATAPTAATAASSARPS